nr:hypothetical protein [Micromonospora sp. DSM 115978]
MSRRLLPIVTLLGAALVVGGATACSSDSPGTATGPGPSETPAATASTQPPDPTRLPVVFVHGGAGSGSQFDTPARRLASNGYPIGHVGVLDYDSTFATATVDQVHTA